VVSNPQLWDLDKPVLYSARARVNSDGNGLMTERVRPPGSMKRVVPFGIREAVIPKPTPASGSMARTIKVKGVSCTRTAAPSGIEVPGRSLGAALHGA